VRDRGGARRRNGFGRWCRCGHLHARFARACRRTPVYVTASGVSKRQGVRFHGLGKRGERDRSSCQLGWGTSRRKCSVHDGWTQCSGGRMSGQSSGAGPTLSLLLGGVRAGKSARALALARSYERTDGVLFVATAQPLDREMERRIAVHRAERPPHWATLESPVELPGDIVGCLTANPGRFGVVVIDCLTLWVSNLLLSLEDGDDAERLIGMRATELLGVVAASTPARRWIVVSNEVGFG